MRRATVLVLTPILAGAAAIAPGGLSAQTNRVIAGDVARSMSTIAIQRVAMLSGPRVLGEPMSIVRMPDGRYFVSDRIGVWRSRP